MLQWLKKLIRGDDPEIIPIPSCRHLGHTSEVKPSTYAESRPEVKLPISHSTSELYGNVTVTGQSVIDYSPLYDISGAQLHKAVSGCLDIYPRPVAVTGFVTVASGHQFNVFAHNTRHMIADEVVRVLQHLPARQQHELMSYFSYEYPRPYPNMFSGNKLY